MVAMYQFLLGPLKDFPDANEKQVIELLSIVYFVNRVVEPRQPHNLLSWMRDCPSSKISFGPLISSLLGENLMLVNLEVSHGSLVIGRLWDLEELLLSLHVDHLMVSCHLMIGELGVGKECGHVGQDVLERSLDSLDINTYSVLSRSEWLLVTGYILLVLV